MSQRIVADPALAFGSMVRFLRSLRSKVWTQGCEEIVRNLSGSAVLDGIDPELLATMEISDRLGHLKLIVNITPDHLRQQHRFECELDQSHLPSIIEQCKTVLSQFD